MPGSLLSVNVVHSLIPDKSGDLDRTAIDKRAVDHPAFVNDRGVLGDVQYDIRHHGGPDQAVYAYAREDYDAWETILGRKLTDGCFGENITTTGLDVTGALIGQTWRIGDVELIVRSPRIPCRTFAGFIGEDKWVKRFTAHGAPGAYFSVLNEGTISAGDPIELGPTPDHDVSIGDLFAVLSGDRERLARVAACPDLLPESVQVLQRMLRPAAAQ